MAFLCGWLRQTSTRLGLLGMAATGTSWFAGDLDDRHAIAALGMAVLGLLFNDRAPDQ